MSQQIAGAGNRLSCPINQDQLDELSSVFNTIDSDGNGYINITELGKALELCGIRLAGYEVRDLLRTFDTKVKDDRLDIEEFKALYASQKKQKDFGRTFKMAVTKREGIENYGGMTESSAQGTTHTVRLEEQVAFTNWINKNLCEDEVCQRYLPMEPESRDLYQRCQDGILFSKLINKSQPDTIDERAINWPAAGAKLSIFQVNENLTLALNSAEAIGCNIVNIGAVDLRAGKPHLVLGLLWQIIRIGLFSDINLHEHPGLAALLFEGESLEELMRLSPEQILIRWVNYHLARSDCGRQIANFTGDIRDSVAYIHLLSQIAPRDLGVSTLAEHEVDQRERAERMLQEADKMGCRVFVSPEDVVTGNYKLNLAFVANLFNSYPALEAPDDIDLAEIYEETREEKTYRNWMNSMGVSPYVNHLYNDLGAGLVIFQLYDIIRKDIVDWSKVIKSFNKMRIVMEKIENCNYAIELGRGCKFSLVGIDGKDIYDGNTTLTLALVWQLMKAYTLSILAKLSGQDSNHPIVDKEIVVWANQKLKNSGKQSHLSSFNDATIADGKVLIDLVDAIKPGSVRYDMVKACTSEQERLENAKYAISMARKIGARVYALPEDIVEVKADMVMTVFACLMIRDFQPDATK